MAYIAEGWFPKLTKIKITIYLSPTDKNTYSCESATFVPQLLINMGCQLTVIVIFSNYSYFVGPILVALKQCKAAKFVEIGYTGAECVTTTEDVMVILDLPNLQDFSISCSTPEVKENDQVREVIETAANEKTHFKFEYKPIPNRMRQNYLLKRINI